MIEDGFCCKTHPPDSRRNLSTLSSLHSWNHVSTIVLSDINFDKWSTSAKLVWQGIWIANFGFSRLMTENLHLGAEVTYLNLNAGASMGTVGMR